MHLAFNSFDRLESISDDNNILILDRASCRACGNCGGCEMPLSEDRYILGLEPPQLEELVKKWIARLLDTYAGFDRPTRSADMGRDAVGFLSKKRYDGEWHNYQCKQLSKPIGLPAFMLELGKIFHYACAGHFTLPTRYIFVAPNGAIGDVNTLIAKPSTIGTRLMKCWDEYCLNRISSPKNPTPLTDDIRRAIENYEFEKVEIWNTAQLIEQPQMRTVMSEHLDIDPGAAPTVSDDEVPEAAEEHETVYVGQLVSVFGEDRGSAFADLAEVASDSTYGGQMTVARRRYMEHRAFGAHFRERIFAHHIQQVDKEVLDHVYDHYLILKGGSKYHRMLSVMTIAASAVVTGPLGKHHRVTNSVRQGACHHFANIGKMPWA